MKKNVWMSYDLGVQGDYDHMYAWLDNHEALECGDSIAYFEYEIPYDMNDSDFLKAIKNDLENTISFNPGNRVYVIRYVPEENTYYGKFIIGRRKASPWEGYGDKAEHIDDGKE